MLRLTLELLPHSNEENAKLLGSLNIVNVGGNRRRRRLLGGPV